MTISVVIPVHNGGADFRRCLASLVDTNPPPLEIVVVSDGDTDGSWETAQRFGARVVRLPASMGPARARNIGARLAQGGVILFVDADVTVPRDAISRVAAALEQEPDIAALFGSYDDEPAVRNFVSQYKNLLHHYVHQTARDDASTFWAGCGAIRRDIFLAHGGFDERYRRPSVEDIELGYRLTRAGHRIRLCKTLQVKHWKRWNLRSLVAVDLLDRALPWTELIVREGRVPNDLNLRVSARVSAIVAYAMVFAVGAAPWRPHSLILAGGLTLLFLGLNAPLYRFFHRKRGLRFAMRSVPLHWLYHLYSGLAFAFGILRWSRARPRASAPTGSKDVTPSEGSGHPGGRDARRV